MAASRRVQLGVALLLSGAAVAWLGGRFSHTAAERRSDQALRAAASPVANPRTAPGGLPRKTNNAWEMPVFEFKGLDGKLHRLADWKGKVIMLNFWASWCAPCQYEIPEFVDYQRQYAGKGLQIVGLGLDGERKLRNVARTLAINYPVLIADLNDPKNTALLPQWGNSRQIVPYTVVIAPNGHIVYIHRGRMDREAFDHYVKPLLEKQSG